LRLYVFIMSAVKTSVCFRVLLLLLSGCISAKAQFQVWRHINTAEMTNPNTNCITEDSSGFVYLGTHEGVNIFDGRHFRPLVIPGRIQKGIDPFTMAMRWDLAGRLWVATRSHIYSYSPRTDIVHLPLSGNSKGNIVSMELDKFRHRLYTVTDNYFSAFKIADTALTPLFQLKITGVLRKMCLAADGAIYLIQDGEQVFKIKDSSISPFYSGGFIKDMDYVHQNNGLILLTSSGLIFYDLGNDGITQLKPKADWDLQSGKTRITALWDGEIFVHDKNGIYLLESLSDTTLVKYAYDEKNPWTIRKDFIHSIFCDSKKNIWVAEEGAGLSILTTASRSVSYLPGTILGAARLWRLYDDSAHNQIFASTENGLCAIRYATGTASCQPNIRPPGFSTFEVMDYIPWEKDILFLLTNGQGCWFFNTSTLQLKSFEPLKKGVMRKGIWSAVVLNTNKFLLFGPDGSFLLERKSLGAIQVKERKDWDNYDPLHRAGVGGVESINMDNKKRLWVGTGNGIYLMDTSFHVLKSYGTGTAERKDGLGNKVILDMKQADDGTMYAATMGGGVYRLTKADTFAQVPLIGNLAIIYCIGVVDKEHLLFTTSKGLCLYNIVTGSSQMLNENNGLPINDYNQLALSHDGKFLLAAGASGVVWMDAKHLLSNFHDTAQLQVMDGGRAIRELTLNKGSQTLDLDITVTGYAANTAWILQYKLDGLDEEWRTMTKGEWHIHYNSVPPGKYQLLVKATDEHGVVWAAPLSVGVQALPFFWQTTWFRLIVFCVGLGVVIAVVRFFSQLSLKWRLKKLEDEQRISKERLRISRELHDNVGTQLTYLITGLESSGILLQKKETGILEEKIEKMQHSARESMQQLRDSIWALNNESVAASVLLSRFEAWLNKMLEAFPEIRVSVVSTINHDILLDPIKSLNLFRIMQEAVHNVLKHAGATDLAIYYASENNRLTISIKDNGKGFNTSGVAGNGRRSMAARAEDMAAEYQVLSSGSTGTEIKVTLEINK
jgi:signal transduction histidine kinase/ligand-binding sensor domain-containing protein